ncbi:MAG: RNA polymerase sigma factor [Actinomycetota bacterium]
MEGRPPDDSDLVVRAKRGDNSAYEELVRRHQSAAYRVAYLVCGGQKDAEDAAQSAFIKAFYALERFDERRPFKPWLLRIASNEARNTRRGAARRIALQARLAEDRPGGAAPSPERAVLAEEPRDVVVRALGRLPERDRLAIAYRYFLELTEAEMATAMGCRRGTVKSRLSRSLARLRGELSGSPDLLESFDG